MKRLLRPKFFALAALVAILSVGAGGVAYGYWSGTGVGGGSGAVGSTVAMTLTPGTPSNSLYPGGQTNVVLTASNPNTAIIHISTLTLNTAQGTSGYSVDAGHASCAVGALTYSTQSNGGSGWNVPAKVGAVNGTLAITLTNSLAMSSTAANACQGATFTIYLVAG